MQIMYLVMFCQSSRKVEYRIISSTKGAYEVAQEFQRKRRGASIIGVYELTQTDWR